jgi:hypothetical protein
MASMRSTLLRDHTFRAMHLVALLDALNGYYVIPGQEPAISQRGAGANMSIDVGAFRYLLAGVLGEKLTTTNVVIGASDGANPRIDSLYVAANGTLTILAGTARAAKPVGEATWQKWEEPYPADFSATAGLLLAEIEVPAGATSIIDAYIRNCCLPNLNGLDDGWIPAAETWTYASADDPTFTFTITGDKTAKYQAGDRIKLTQTTVKYFIITKVAYGSPNTTITVYGGTDYDLANAAITLPYYSKSKSPQGFPRDPAKWSVVVTDTSDRSQSNPGDGTWYNLGSMAITVPIGSWYLRYSCMGGAADSSGTAIEFYITLSTANNSESNTAMTVYNYLKCASGAIEFDLTVEKGAYVLPTAKTVYYLLIKSGLVGADVTIALYNSYVPGRLEAVCSYL